MTKKWLIFWIILFIVSHYLHHQFNRLRSPFFNTVFSDRQLFKHFYNVDIGETRATVEERIGKPLSIDGDRFYYSKPGDAVLFSNFWVSFRLSYKNDTVVEKFVYFDD